MKTPIIINENISQTRIYSHLFDQVSEIQPRTPKYTWARIKTLSLILFVFFIVTKSNNALDAMSFYWSIKFRKPGKQATDLNNDRVKWNRLRATTHNYVQKSNKVIVGDIISQVTCYTSEPHTSKYVYKQTYGSKQSAHWRTWTTYIWHFLLCYWKQLDHFCNIPWAILLNPSTLAFYFLQIW